MQSFSQILSVLTKDQRLMGLTLIVLYGIIALAAEYYPPDDLIDLNT